MRRVDDLILGPEFLLEVPEQVGLRLGMETQSRLVEKYDDAADFFPTVWTLLSLSPTGRELPGT